MLSRLKHMPACKIVLHCSCAYHSTRSSVLYMGTAYNISRFAKSRLFQQLRKHQCCWHEQCGHWRLGCEQIYLEAYTWDSKQSLCLAAQSHRYRSIPFCPCPLQDSLVSS